MTPPDKDKVRMQIEGLHRLGLVDDAETMERLLAASEGPDRTDALEDKLDRIKQWCRAYPRTVFIEPTKAEWKRANEVLKETEGCPSLSAISGSNMRHVVEGIQEIIDYDPV